MYRLAIPRLVVVFAVGLGTLLMLPAPLPKGSRNTALAAPPPIQRGELTRAVAQGEINAVKALIERGANINENLGTTQAPLTPLLVALVTNREIVEYLLNKGADATVLFNGWLPWDLSSRLYGEEDGATHRLAFESQKPAPKKKEDLPEAVWVANGLGCLYRNEDDGTALGLRYVAAAYSQTSESTPNREEILSRAEKLRKAVKELDKEKKPTETRPVYSAAQLSSFLWEEGNTDASENHINLIIARDLLQRETVPIEKSEPERASIAFERSVLPFSVVNGLTVASAVSRDGFRTRALEAAYKVGKKDPSGAGWVVDQFVASQFEVKLSDSPTAIQLKMPAHFPEPVRKVLKTVAEAAAKWEDVKSAWSELQIELKHQTATKLEGLRHLPAPGSPPTIPVLDNEQFIPKMEASLHLLTTLAGIVKPELASKIEAVGKAGLFVYKAIDQFSQAANLAARAGKVLSSLSIGINLATNLLSAASLIASLIPGLSGPSPEQLILEQLQQLRQQVEELREEMHKRFDRIEAMLGTVLETLTQGLKDVREDIARAREELRVVTFQLALMEQVLLRIEPKTRDYLATLGAREQWRQVRACLERERQHDLPLSLREFVDCTDRLVAAGTRDSKDQLEVGDPLTGAQLGNEKLFAVAMSQLADGGFSRNVAKLQTAARFKFGLLGRFGEGALANPLEWAMAANAYEQLLTKHPEFARYVSPDGCEQFLRVGREWQDALQSLSTIKSDGAMKSNEDFHKHLWAYYSEQAKHFRETIKDRIAKYQNEKVRGFDLWAGAKQAVPAGASGGFSLTEVLISSMEEVKKIEGNFNPARASRRDPSDWKLTPSPNELADASSARKVIDPAILNAHQVGLGTLSVSYSNPFWADAASRPAPNRLDEDRVYGKAAIHLNGTITFKEGGKTYPVFSETVAATEEYNYGIVAYEVSIKPEFKPIVFRPGRPVTVTLNMVNRKWRWSHGNVVDGATTDPNTEVAFRKQLQKNWADMAKRVFAKKDDLPERIRKEAVDEAVKRIDKLFSRHREILEAQLYLELQQGDGDLIDASRRLATAKLLVRTYLSLALPQSAAGPELQELLDGTPREKDKAAEKGKTGLLDLGGIQAIQSEKVGLLDVARDAEWMDRPIEKLSAAVRDKLGHPEPQPLIEQMIKRMEALKRVQEASRPSMARDEALRELQRQVRLLKQ
jgi:hypothetical protein